MKTFSSLLALLLIANFTVLAQQDSLYNLQNSAAKLMNTDSRLTIGGYAQLDYNQPVNADFRSNGELDVHRLVMLFGYKFSDKTQFITEVEYEHVKEVYVEQAFVSHRFNRALELRGGLMLVPMGIVNEYHEPPTFNGVERPTIDGRISPTTWREMGIGLTGYLTRASIRYQAYIFNGFNGYDGAAKLNGKNGFRSGRQKGAESYMSSPTFGGKVEYYGILGLNVGLSGYFGKTQSTLYNGIAKDDQAALATADSSVVGINMIGIDARYNKMGFVVRGQFYVNNVTNTDQYNAFTGSDLGSKLYGYYVEAGYNVLQGNKDVQTELIPFIRYEELDTQAKISSEQLKNSENHQKIVTFGLTCKLNKGVAFKADYQSFNKEGVDKNSGQVNLGIGVWF